MGLKKKVSSVHRKELGAKHVYNTSYNITELT